jgi:hypothetical protein
MQAKAMANASSAVPGFVHAISGLLEQQDSTSEEVSPIVEKSPRKQVMYQVL